MRFLLFAIACAFYPSQSHAQYALRLEKIFSGNSPRPIAFHTEKDTIEGRNDLLQFERLEENCREERAGQEGIGDSLPLVQKGIAYARQFSLA